MKIVGDYEYDEDDVLGEGAFGVVYKGRDMTKLNEAVAIKSVRKSSKGKDLDLPDQIKREIAILQKLSNTTHKNIVTLLHYEQQAYNVYLVMEFCNGGSLKEYLQSERKLGERTISLFLRQIAAGLKNAHEMNIIHRDLKPDNILLCFSGPRYPSPNDITLKISGFEIGRFLESDEMARTFCGTVQYMAPEVFWPRRGGYDYKVDMWSVGVIAYECLVGPLPRDSLISRDGFVMPNDITPELSDLLTGLLEKDEHNRFTLKQFCDHQFFAAKQFCDHQFFAATISVCVQGSEFKRNMIHFNNNQSVDDLIDTIFSIYNTDSEHAYLIHNARPLEHGSGNSLTEAGIVNGSTILFALRLRGG